MSRPGGWLDPERRECRKGRAAEADGCQSGVRWLPGLNPRDCHPLRVERYEACLRCGEPAAPPARSDSSYDPKARCSRWHVFRPP